MLVLSRRVGEKLLIGDDIVITIIDTRGDGVRIGIDAPRSMRVNRAEVVEAVRHTNLEAASTGDDAEALLRSLVAPATTGTSSTGTSSTGTSSTAGGAPAADAGGPGSVSDEGTAGPA